MTKAFSIFSLFLFLIARLALNAQTSPTATASPTATPAVFSTPTLGDLISEGRPAQAHPSKTADKPVAPSAIEDEDPATFPERARAVGFPLLIKPAAGAVFSLYLLLTTRGRDYSFDETAGWLGGAGFIDIQMS